MKALGKFYESQKERELQTVFLVSGIRNGTQHVGLFTHKAMVKACAELETVISQELYCIALPTAPPVTLKLIHSLVKRDPVKEEVKAPLAPEYIKTQKQVLITHLLHPSISKSKNFDKAKSSDPETGSFDCKNNVADETEDMFDDCDEEVLCQQLNSAEEGMEISKKKFEVNADIKIQSSITSYMIKLHQPTKPSRKWSEDLERDFEYIELCVKNEESFLLAELAEVEEKVANTERERLLESREHEKVNTEHLKHCDAYYMQNMGVNEDSDTMFPICDEKDLGKQLLSAEKDITN